MRPEDIEEDQQVEGMRTRQAEFFKNRRRDFLQRDITKQRLQTIDNSAFANISLKLTHLTGYRDEGLVRNIIEWLQLPREPARLDEFLSAVESKEISKQHFGMIGLRKILTEYSNWVIQYVIDRNVLSTILGLLSSEHLHLRLEAAWCIANLSNGTSAQTACIVRKNGLPLLLEVSQSPFPQIAEQAVWALGNIIGDSPEFRQLALRIGIVTLLASRFSNSELALKKIVLWVFASLCKQRAPKEPLKELEPALKVLVQGIVDGLPETSEEIEDTVEALARMVCKKTLDSLINPPLFAKLKEYFDASLAGKLPPAVANHCNAIFGSEASGEAKHVDLLLDAGLLDSFAQALQNDSELWASEVCWILSNIALSDERQVAKLLERKALMQGVLALIASNGEDKSSEALWVVCNLCKVKNSILLNQIFELGLLNIFHIILKDNVEQKCSLVLEALTFLLEYFQNLGPEENRLTKQLVDFGIADLIESKQFDPSTNIYLKANLILKKYFVLEN